MKRAMQYYHFSPPDDVKISNEAYLEQYNKEMDEAESEIDAGNYLTQERVKQHYANKRKGKSKD